MLYPNPNFSFLLLKRNWQASLLKLSKYNKAPYSSDSLQLLISSNTQSTELSLFLNEFEISNHKDFDYYKGVALKVLEETPKNQLKEYMKHFWFYYEFLALFPEKFVFTIPDTNFSEQLVKNLKKSEFNLQQELHYKNHSSIIEISKSIYHVISTEFIGSIADAYSNNMSFSPSLIEDTLFKQVIDLCTNQGASLLISNE